jgi:CHAD domain-containing protein
VTSERDQGEGLRYYLTRDETVDAGFRRICLEQIDLAVAQVHDPGLDVAETVHEVRRRCKRIRAALRLVRGSLQADGTFRSENRAFRDLARSLADSRDAHVQLATLAGLVEAHQDVLDSGQFAAISDSLSARIREANHLSVLGDRFRAFLRGMEDARGRMSDWPDLGNAFHSVGPGLEKTYRRARRALRRALDSSHSEVFHELRKRAQYHRFHCALLTDLWPRIMDARQHEMGDLTDVLGEANDLAVLHETLIRSSGPQDAAVEVLLGLADRRTAELQARAREMGARLFAESPPRFSRRIETLWSLRRGVG